MDELIKKISITEDGPEKNKLLDELSSLHLLNKKREEEKFQEIKKKEELELRLQEDIILQKYKSLFEKRMKAFDYACPKCGSLCQDRIVTIGHHPYSNTFSALFCTNSGCDESRQRGWYDCDDTVGIDKDRCVKKIYFN